MRKFIDTVSFWISAARGHTIPTSFMSWLFPFIFGLTDGGNTFFGGLALIGIISVHLGVNLLDDIFDYYFETKRLSTNNNVPFNTQKGKCRYLISGGATLAQTIFVTIGLFSLASAIGLFLAISCGWQVLLIAAIGACLCLFYPFATKFGLGEITVGIVYAPLLCLGTYFVMTKTFSPEVMIISISTGLLTVGLLHTSTLLDYDFDLKTKKITICTIVGNTKNAVIAQGVIMLLAYLNVIVAVLTGFLPAIMLLSLLAIPTSVSLCRLMMLHIKDPKVVIPRTFWMGPMGNWDNTVKNNLESFMIKFLLARNVMLIFTVFICIAKIISELTR